MIDEESKDNKIESILKRYRLVGPSAKLKEKIFGDSEIVTIKLQSRRKNFKRFLIRSGAAAAVLIVVAGFMLTRKQQAQPQIEIPRTFAEIEYEIEQAGNAARLLAAADIFTDDPDSKDLVNEQYAYIIAAYPQTDAAAEAKLRMKVQ